MLTIFVITIVRKELFEIRLSFLHSIILCKIVVNDLLNNQNILKDIFEEKRGQRQKWWRRDKFCTLIFFDIQISYIFQSRRVIFQKNSHNRDGFFFPPWDIIVPPANTRNSSCLPDCLQKSTTSRENPWLQ